MKRFFNNAVQKSGLNQKELAFWAMTFPFVPGWSVFLGAYCLGKYCINKALKI